MLNRINLKNVACALVAATGASGVNSEHSEFIIPQPVSCVAQTNVLSALSFEPFVSMSAVMYFNCHFHEYSTVCK